MNVELLRRELNLIKDEALKNKVEAILQNIPEVMEHKPSSSSGRYHPDFDNSDGGNIKHTKAVVKVAEKLVDGFSSWDYAVYNLNADYIYAACILHDMCKYGTDPDTATHTVHEHPKLAGDLIRSDYPHVAFLIDSHMGKWNTSKYSNVTLPVPVTFMQKIVHIADCIASQKWISDKILD